jgi:two-component system response regulator (stage 0 sporulation protein F)
VSDAEKSILIVDDDDAIRGLLRTILQRRGLATDSARDGREALECLKRSRYALMLLDLMMPRESGWDVLGEIARWPLDRRPIIIVITAGTEPRTLDPSLVAGTVRKPFDIDMLVDTVTACVRGGPARKKPDDQPSPTQTIN